MYSVQAVDADTQAAVLLQFTTDLGAYVISRRLIQHGGHEKAAKVIGAVKLTLPPWAKVKEGHVWVEESSPQTLAMALQSAMQEKSGKSILYHKDVVRKIVLDTLKGVGYVRTVGGSHNDVWPGAIFLVEDSGASLSSPLITAKLGGFHMAGNMNESPVMNSASFARQILDGIIGVLFAKVQELTGSDTSCGKGGNGEILSEMVGEICEIVLNLYRMSKKASAETNKNPSSLDSLALDGWLTSTSTRD